MMIQPNNLALLEGAIKPSQPIVQILDGGLETTVQDYPGREGGLQMGIPRSGPMDRTSFALGNQLLNNPLDAAGIEIQFIGPKLKFYRETVIAITGADNHPQINQKPIPLWTNVFVQPGDLLTFGHAEVGARSYIHFAGGLDVPVVMGSRSTFVRANFGGLAGRALKSGDVLTAFAPLTPLEQLQGRSLPPATRPQLSHQWRIDVLLGPHDDWLTARDITQFVNTDWQVSPKSDRVGYRLDGPDFEFSYNAHHKPAENGDHPSNKIDYGCPLGTILFCGQTPTILMVDGPSLTGYMAPFTVAEASLWQVGQARPGDVINFQVVDLATALQQS
ncbi:biotin-dependent carboxyltransferase [filamentous cyanobacterium LEGE 11480]|uniref:Biotin-dependent carboxyltransferase n=1 Tax=Romeriopsis navalis LEGE 11480 TaxID=2777977 RepID=A0A928Z626_9CYAN|nr:biotin-dependent carboxyltransferase family protein [Romeriopsis navalis]MBE9031850.1 biotin-dependent carboxyltransferase [Romeriopsis navalis LEGE 11480]